MAKKTNSPPKPYLGFGTRIRKSPFFESTLKWGCKEYTTYNHMYFPVYYNTPENTKEFPSHSLIIRMNYMYSSKIFATHVYNRRFSEQKNAQYVGNKRIIVLMI